MDPADVLAELKDSGHDLASASASLEEENAVRALDAAVHRVEFQRDSELLGAAFVKDDTSAGAYFRAVDALGIAPDGYTAAATREVGLPGEALTETVIPREMRNRLLSPAELAELERTAPERAEALADAQTREALPADRWWV